jgi:hypothetical protein
MEQDFWQNRLKTWTALDPVDRISEVIFGLIMVLTFTGTISVSSTGKQEVNSLLWAALGCNVAWGLVDAIMNLLTVFLDRERDINQIRQIQQTTNAPDLKNLIRGNLSPLLSELMNDDEVDQLGEKVKKLPEPSHKKSLTFKDFIISGQIFMLVFLSTFPVVLPFLFLDDVSIAMRISNGVALVMLLGLGFSLARYAGLKPILTSLVFTGIGIFLVSLTIVLGG